MRPALISAMISGTALIARGTAGEGAADWSIACRRVGFTIAVKVVTGTLIILRRHAAATGWRQHRVDATLQASSISSVAAVNSLFLSPSSDMTL
jgi:hypothetical protein